MTLARGSIGGYEYDRMVLKFSMLDGARRVPCAVSASAMDDLERGARTAPTQREERFVRLRDRIEQCAARKFRRRSSKASRPKSFCAASILETDRRHAVARRWRIGIGACLD